jgi:hypothetical protein
MSSKTSTKLITPFSLTPCTHLLSIISNNRVRLGRKCSRLLQERYVLNSRKGSDICQRMSLEVHVGVCARYQYLGRDIWMIVKFSQALVID